MSRTDQESVVFTHEDGRTQGAYVGSQLAETLAADPAWTLGESKAKAEPKAPARSKAKAEPDAKDGATLGE